MARVTRIDIQQHEGWLQLACLLLSLALHVALGAVGWHGFGPAESGPEPVVVALVGRLAPLPAGPAPAARSPRPAAVPAKARGRSTAAAPAPARAIPVAAPAATPQPVAAPVTVEPTASGAVPAENVPLPAGTITAEAAGGGRDDGSQAGVGAGAGSGAGGAGLGGIGAGGGSGSGNLVRATPRYESNPPPPYPRVARQNHWEGTVRLRARVTAAGRVEGVSLERSSGHEVLDRAALEGVRGWRFIPATRGGLPVACEVSIPVAFRLTE